MQTFVVRISLVSITTITACAGPSSRAIESGTCATCSRPQLSLETDDVVVRDGFLYYTHATEIVRQPLAGGSPMTVVDTSAVLAAGGSPVELAVDDTNVYWVGINNIWTAPLAGGAPTKLFESSADSFIAVIRLDDDYVYWGGNGGLVRYAKNRGAIETLVANTDLITDIAVDSSDVYWAAPHTGTIGRYHKATGAVDGIAPSPASSHPQYVALAASDVYWTTIDGPSTVLARASRATGKIEQLGSALGFPGPVVVDDANLYWVTAGYVGSYDPSRDAIRWRALGANADQVVHVGNVQHLASDASSLYWVGYPPGTNPQHVLGVLSKCGCGMAM
jgi:hypothetical protein